jgi:Glycogen recognition site of AMP-activated protein kinase/5'-AMP-activated protein kinase beta subunit, interaction domain
LTLKILKQKMSIVISIHRIELNSMAHSSSISSARKKELWLGCKMGLTNTKNHEDDDFTSPMDHDGFTGVVRGGTRRVVSPSNSENEQADLKQMRSNALQNAIAASGKSLTAGASSSSSSSSSSTVSSSSSSSSSLSDSSNTSSEQLVAENSNASPLQPRIVHASSNKRLSDRSPVLAEGEEDVEVVLATPRGLAASPEDSSLLTSASTSLNKPSSLSLSSSPIASSSSSSSALSVASKGDSPRDDSSGDDDADSDDENLPTMFTWSQGGTQVFVTGTWDNWKSRIPLSRSSKDFSAIAALPPGLHQYKFVVDGRWKHAPDQPLTADLHGNLNNCCEIKPLSDRLADENTGQALTPPGEYGQWLPDYARQELGIDEDDGGNDDDVAAPTGNGDAKDETEAADGEDKDTSDDVAIADQSSSAKATTSTASDRRKRRGEASKRNSELAASLAIASRGVASSAKASTRPPADVAQDFFDYKQEPPTLPPHLHRALLNMPRLDDEPNMLPLPHHVMLDHLYLMRRDTIASDQDMAILGATHRYKAKFVSTVFYKPMS